MMMKENRLGDPLWFASTSKKSIKILLSRWHRGSANDSEKYIITHIMNKS